MIEEPTTIDDLLDLASSYQSTFQSTLCKSRPEDMAAKYIAQKCVGIDHLKALHKSLSGKWCGLSSLSAALDLMKDHGVVLTPAETKTLAQMEEGEQIGALVNKVPTQGADEFKEFFVKLQLLVGSATYMRQGIDDGRSELVGQALDVAEATGVQKHMVKVGVVQAGTQADILRVQAEPFRKEAGNRLTGLVGGQQFAMSNLKHLEDAEAALHEKGRVAVARRVAMANGFSGRSDSAFMSMVFAYWHRLFAMEVLERRVEAEFKERVKDMEDTLVAWKQQRLDASKAIFLREALEEDMLKMQDSFRAWHDACVGEKLRRDIDNKLTAGMESAKAATLEIANNFVARLRNSIEATALESAWQAWQHSVSTVKEEKNFLAKLAANEKQNQEKVAEKKTLSRTVLCAMVGDDRHLYDVCFKAWVDEVGEEKRERELQSTVAQKNAKFTAVAKSARGATAVIMDRAATSDEETLLTLCIVAWIKYTQLEKVMRRHASRIDAKRQQLLGVHQMFKSFAMELETGFGDNKSTKPAIEAGEVRKERHGKGGSMERGEKNTRSAPNLHDA